MKGLEKLEIEKLEIEIKLLNELEEIKIASEIGY